MVEKCNKLLKKKTYMQQMEKNAQLKQMDLISFVKIVKKYKKIFCIALSIVFIISAVYIYSVPRYYTTETSLAPEEESNSFSGGQLNSIASSFGIDLNNMNSTDAITPLLYPSLMDDDKFVVDLFKIKIRTIDNTIVTDYYSYLTKYKKSSWISKCLKGITSFLKSSYTTNKAYDAAKTPYCLSKKDAEIVTEIKKDIRISVDKATGVITVFATAQDPLICQILADSVTQNLKTFIINYRTAKAKEDVEHYKRLMDESLDIYRKARNQYAYYADANNDVMLESVKSKLEELENDMQLKYNQYTSYNTQYQIAVAKLREKTPVFTKLQGASVPQKPAGPKRILTIIGALLFTFFIILAIIISKQLLKNSK